MPSSFCERYKLLRKLNNDNNPDEAKRKLQIAKDYRFPLCMGKNWISSGKKKNTNDKQWIILFYSHRRSKYNHNSSECTFGCRHASLSVSRRHPLELFVTFNPDKFPSTLRVNAYVNRNVIICCRQRLPQLPRIPHECLSMMTFQLFENQFSTNEL